MTQRIFWSALILGCLMVAPAIAQSSPTCGPLDDGRVANVFYQGTAVFFEPIVEYEYDLAVLTISGPCEDIVRNFKRGEEISFDIREIERVTDGHYTWQLRFEPTIDPGVREELQASRGTGEEDAVWWQFWQKGAIPVGPRVDSESFTVFRGGIIDPNSGEEKRASVAGRRATASVAASAAGIADGGASSASEAGDGPVLGTKDVVFNDDMIVQASLCVGFDCVNGEVFSFDTIRLKENNLRIKFEDTSGGSFPTRDWEIEANSSANGGQTHLRFNDVDAGRSPFTVEGNSPSHSLYVDSSGRVGMGTSTPVVELHVASGDSPALRLDQNTSSGFAAQVWDVAGNETNFFVRDATNGSTLPFRIFPGSSSSSLVIRDSDIGVGTSAPGTFDNGGDQAAVHIRRTSASESGLLIERATTTAASDVLLELRNNGTPRFDMIDTSSGTEWRFEASGAGFNINDLADGGTAEFVVQPDGDVIIEGSLTVGPGGCTGCDLVFSPEYEVESIEDHAAYMWANSHLPGVGPTPEDQPMNLSKKTGGILNELEKAHIYIEELHARLEAKEGQVEELAVENDSLEERLTEIEAILLSLRGGN